MALCAADSRRCSAKIAPGQAAIAVVEGLGLPEGNQHSDADGDTPSHEARAWRWHAGSRYSVETRAYPTSMRPTRAPEGKRRRWLPTGVKRALAGRGIVSKTCSRAGAVERLYRTACLLDQIPTSAYTGDACDSVKCTIMEHTIRATDLARNLGDVLSKVRYRRDSFVVSRHGRPVARVVPIGDETKGATLGEALSIWCDGGASDPALADDLEAINSSDRPPSDRWES